MSTVAKNNDGENFKPVPQGVHLAICIMVIDGGIHYNQMYNIENQLLKLVWEIPGETIEFNGGIMPMTIQQNYTNSLGSKANLRKALESWRGQGFTKEELDGFDVAKVLGAPCQIQVIHNIKGDKTYGNISTIIPAIKGIQIPKPIHPLIHFDLDKKTDESWASLPEWIQKWIMKSKAFQGHQAAEASQMGMPQATAEQNSDGSYPDIPF